jgi:kynurenine formamidase
VTDEYRVQFDADVTFVNGGGLRAQGFRLDLPSPSASDEEVAELFVRHLGLLMVGSVRISGKTVLREVHMGSRGVEPGATAATRLFPDRPRAGEADLDAARLVELSHRIVHGMTTYPGLPGPEITDHLSREASRARYAEGTEFQIGRISMVANTGTYLDTPAHRFASGADLSAVGLDRLADLPGLKVRVPDGVVAIDRMLLAPYDVRGHAVLLHTGWDRHWSTPAYGAGGHAYLTEDGAALLADRGAALVGIDSVNIDDTSGSTRPAHTTLLRHGIPIVEHLRGLEVLPPRGFRFHAAPPLVSGMGSFPVRAYAVLMS